MNRRSFFSRIARAAVIAVATPVILREVIRAELPRAITLEEYSAAYDQYLAEKRMEEIFQLAYEIKRQRIADGTWGKFYFQGTESDAQHLESLGMKVERNP